MLLMQKELTGSESDCEHFEGAVVLVIKAKVISNAWFS